LIKFKLIKRKKIRQRNRILLNILLLMSIGIVLIPLFWMVSSSLKTEGELFQTPPSFIPERPTVGNYLRLFQEGVFWPYLRNSLIVSLLTTGVSIILAVFAGFALSAFRFRLRIPLLLFFISLQMFPMVVMLLTIFLFMNRLGLLNTYLSLVISYTSFALPFSIWMIKNYFDSIPKELIEASRIDGCSHLQVLKKIIFPVAAPGITAVAIFSFVTSWNEFLYAYTLTNTPRAQTLPPGMMLSYIGQFKIEWNEMMAACVISTLPTLLIFIFLQRFFVEGLTKGAVKG